MKLLFVVIIVFILVYVYMSRPKGPEDVWKRYKLTPFKSEELDDWMEALHTYREAYESVENNMPVKVVLRLNVEETRKSILDWYKGKAEELGLDPLTAENFSLDVIRQEKI